MRLACPKCGNQMEIPNPDAGLLLTCPECGESFRLALAPAPPAADGDPAAQAAPPPPPIPPAGPPHQQYQPQPPGYPRPTDIGDDAGMRLLLPVGRSGWAIAAGYVGLLSILLVPAPLAVLLGIVAAVDLKWHPDKHGWGRTVFSLVMGVWGMIVLAFVILVVIGR